MASLGCGGVATEAPAQASDSGDVIGTLPVSSNPNGQAGDATSSPSNTLGGATLSLVNGVGTVPLSGCPAFDYLAEVNVGGQVLNLLVDSGSTTMALPISSCTTCSPAAEYTPSATSTRVGRSVSSTYGDGSSWSGVTYSDRVALGDANTLASPSVRVTFAGITRANAFFEEIDSCTASGTVPFDGIFGVGPDTQLVPGTTSFLSQVAATGELAHDLFALHLCDVGGTMTLGGFDANAMASQPNYTPLSTANSVGAYAMSVSALALGSSDFGVASSSLGPMVVDNGTNFLILSSAAYSKFTSLLQADATYQANFSSTFITAQNATCAKASSGATRAQLDAALPKLVFTLPRVGGGSFQVALPATSSYLTAIAFRGDSTQSTYYCPAITDDGGSGIYIFGNNTMRNHVVLFDRENAQLGFAPQQGCSQVAIPHSSGT